MSSPGVWELSLGKHLLPAVPFPALILPEDAREGPAETVMDRPRVPGEDHQLNLPEGRAWAPEGCSAAERVFLLPAVPTREGL